MKTCLAAAALTCVAACTCTPPVGDSAPPVSDSAPPAREVTFGCAPDADLRVRFFPAQGVAVLLRDGDTLELQQQPSASGFIYSNGPTTIRGKGDALTVEIGRMVPLQCRARQTTPIPAPE